MIETNPAFSIIVLAPAVGLQPSPTAGTRRKSHQLCQRGTRTTASARRPRRAAADGVFYEFIADPSVSVTLSAPCRSIKCHQGRIRKQRVRRVNASVGSNVKIIRGIAGNAKCCDVPLFIVRRHPQMSTQSRPRTSVVAAKGQDDQEIVVDAKVKAIRVDDLFPPSRGKRTFVQ